MPTDDNRSANADATPRDDNAATPRTLSEIIETAKDGDRPTPDECYHAMLMLDALSTFTTTELRRAAFANDKFITVQDRAESDHQRWRRALGAVPATWLGSNMPGAPGQAKRRRASKNIAAYVLAKMDGES